MRINYNLKERKPFVQALEEITGVKSVYKKPPTFAYEVDCFKITRDGNLEFDDRADAAVIKKVLEELENRGFSAEVNPYQEEKDESEEGKQEIPEEDLSKENLEEQKETLGLTVAMPKKYFKEGTFENLKNLVASKETLIKKALGIAELPITETEEKVLFPWFAVKPADNDEVTAYTHFIYSLCEMARNQKRVHGVEKEVENEKYAFRCFLLRLGFIGDQFKKERKILLRNLSGSAAFKNNKDKGGTHEIFEQTDSRED